MLSSVLRSPRAVEVNTAIMRTFVQLRRLMDSNRDLVRKIEAMEKKYDEQFAVVFDAIKRLIANDHAQTARPQRRIGLPEALDDIARLYDFVAEKNARAAQSIVTCIKAAIRQLGQFPEIGRSMADDTGPREIFAAFGAGAYVLRY